MACVQRAKVGRLMEDLPAEISGFAVASMERGVHLARSGRALTAAEGAALRNAMQTDVLAGGVYSTSRCTGVDGRACIQLQQWVCQVSLDALAQRIAASAAKLGLADVGLDVWTTVQEARGPVCKAGASCLPAQHYSTKGTYDPRGRRDATTAGSGVCADDGDCEGQDSEGCYPWYLRGGGEIALYRQHARPIWCGCVQERCSWFTQ
jgi:hypothetical protein